MGPPRLDVEARGVTAAAHHVEQLGLRARDVRGVSYKVRTVFRKAEEQRFAKQGPGWAALAATTRERKARQRLDPRTLRAKQVLYRSLTSPRAAMQVDRREPTEFEFGTTVPYAKFHHEGRGVPQRKLIDLRPSEQKAINDAIEDFIAKGETH